ncbi:hypothetical protein PsorP6_004472 [Peronosclerospora sorghi]|uniref:Uncharacterized protein n=1 Tax=Peronosclerospora sorghi TaxID=230839 RepID=A0ACC0VKC1_9STRA|nr:hypothetical protein PsorP6_004472 [Peronosclerospora sorghi]
MVCVSSWDNGCRYLLDRSCYYLALTLRMSRLSTNGFHVDSRRLRLGSLVRLYILFSIIYLRLTLFVSICTGLNMFAMIGFFFASTLQFMDPFSVLFSFQACAVYWVLVRVCLASSSSRAFTSATNTRSMDFTHLLLDMGTQATGLLSNEYK